MTYIVKSRVEFSVMRVVPSEKKGKQLSNRIIQRNANIDLIFIIIKSMNANHPNGHPNGLAFETELVLCRLFLIFL